MSNKHYKITYFSHLGCKAQMTIETPYYICRDSASDLCVFDEEGCIGNESLLQHILNQHLNQTKACCVVNAEPLII